ncbi:toll-like receptor 4 [Branchiostoma floridae]|uniref:Toll-like receptor 4 n=1 Tax=Branchiostoma floridae TaxID=7739 RepID=A0A9J7KIA4_BRAFL|nr:toll-like receptor 4 [Branchiostoma floridae]
MVLDRSLPLAVSLGVAAAGVVAMVVMVTGLVVRRRKKYDPDLGWDKPDPDAEYNIPYENELPKYDIFISYSSKDLAFAKDILLKELTCRGYEVCVDFKDFTPGVFIVDNIKEGVFRSRKTIIVLSSNFRKSGFGRFELQMAGARKYLERKDVLIVVKIDQCKVPTMLIGRTFLDWTNENVRPHFWQRLENAIGPDEKVRNRKDDKDNQEEDDDDDEEETITAADDHERRNNAVNGHVANGGSHILGLPETDLLENEDRPLLAVV